MGSKLMIKSFFALVLLLSVIEGHAQRKQPFFMQYFDGSRIETKQKLGQYLLFFGYTGGFSETDSTVDIEVSQADADWKLSSSFYFGKSDSCKSITHTRCDKYVAGGLDRLLGNKKAWRRINDRMYVARNLKGELIEVLRNDSCFVYRISQVSLTPRQVRTLARQKLLGSHRITCKRHQNT